MTTHGSSGYPISISSAIAGSPSGPSGNIVYLYAQEYDFDRDPILKTKYNVNGTSYTSKKGGFKRKVSLKGCMIIDDDGNATTNTQSLNNKVTLLESWQDLSGSPVYLILTSDIDSVNLALSRTAGSTTQIDYMKGYTSKIHGKPVGGHYELDLEFTESTEL